MARCLLALGSNLGDRQAILTRACAEIALLPHSQLLARSRWHATTPIGGVSGQGEFLNGAILVETALDPPRLAAALQATETRLGRERVVRWDARTIDIDVLLYAARVIDTADLVVPHPRMTFRDFVLQPAAEVAGAMLHPTSGWTIVQLLAHIQNAPRYVVVTANKAATAKFLVSHLSAVFGCSEWLDADNCLASAYSSQSGARVEFPTHASGEPPLMALLSPETLGTFANALLLRRDLVRPALMIALDSGADEDSPTPTEWLNHPGLGPVARITAEQHATIAQEAEAALRCIWSDLS